MLPAAFFTRRRVAEILVVLVATVCLIMLTGPVVLAGLDRNQRCVSNTGRIAVALSSYVQDYDERFPLPTALSDPIIFQTTLSPYVQGDVSVFRCPANGNAFYTPNAALGGQDLYAFRYLDEVEAVRDSQPHPDGELTISFLDGHVERGGIDQTPPDVSCRQRVQQITLALGEYTQDYDEQLPYQQNDDDFRQALQPYLHSEKVWQCPDTKQPYNLSQDFRGKSLASFSDTSTVIVIQDPVPHQDGIVTTGYLDGYVEQRGPHGITYPPPTSSLDNSITNIKQLSFGLVQYEQDYDEHLPIYTNYSNLLPIMLPYLGRGSRTFKRFNQPTYQANPDLSGTLLPSYFDPHSVAVFRDVYNFGDGKITVGYLDGHVDRVAPTLWIESHPISKKGP